MMVNKNIIKNNLASPFITKYQNDYPPKMSEMQNPLMDNNTIRQSNINFGNDKLSYGTSSHQKVYPYNNNINNSNLSNDLRQHHFQFGNDNFNGISTQKRDYQPYNNQKIPLVNTSNLQKSHFNFGNKIFQGTTTYMNDYTIKPLPNNDCLC